LFEGRDIGEDTGSPIDFSYTPPFRFTGKLNKVTVELKPESGGASVAVSGVGNVGSTVGAMRAAALRRDHASVGMYTVD